MIPRYELKEISAIWTDEHKFKTYLKVELAILEAFEESRLVPPGTCQKIKEKATISPSRIDEIEKTVKHDVIAFTTSITENLAPDLGKYFHYGVTSSDIIDTALSLQIKESLQVIHLSLKQFLSTLLKKAEEHRTVMTIGRSHGMYAEPMGLGQKILGHFVEFARREEELQHILNTEFTAQFSGAVGNYTIVTPELEKIAATKLGLKVEPVSTQVIPRDRHAKILQWGALLGAAVERFCVELRHLHRSEVNEFEEGFSAGQKGSSIMPHKKNPIAAENLTGMARILKSHANIALENIPLWHERDISHSSAERLMLPDHFGILQYVLKRLNGTLENGIFKTENIEQRVLSQFAYLSSYYLHDLIKNTDIKREELYYFVQQAAFQTQSHSNGVPKPESFTNHLSQVLKEKGINYQPKHSTVEEIRRIYLKSVDEVFQRVRNQYPKKY